MENIRSLLSLFVAMSLLRQHMNDHRAVVFLGPLQRVLQRGNVVAVDGAEIVKAQRLKEALVHKNGLDRILHPQHRPAERRTDHRDTSKTLLHHLFRAGPALADPQIGQVLTQRTHVGRNGHFIIVQNQNQLGFAVARVVQRLIAHTAGQGPIAHQRHHMIVLSLKVPCPCQSQRRRDRRGGMSRFKGVAGTFAPLGKAGNAAEGAQGVEHLIPPRQQLMHIALVSHVKDDLIFGDVKHAVQRQCQLHHPQIGGQMSAAMGHRVNDLPANFRCQVG